MEMEKTKTKVQALLNNFQGELKKTTVIGRKMLTASRTNSKLKRYYEVLGQLAVEALEDGSLTWDNKNSQELLAKIEKSKKDLNIIEDEVKKIKVQEQK